jgi:hypothetical protein
MKERGSRLKHYPNICLELNGYDRKNLIIAGILSEIRNASKGRYRYIKLLGSSNT